MPGGGTLKPGGGTLKSIADNTYRGKHSRTCNIKLIVLPCWNIFSSRVSSLQCCWVHLSWLARW